MVDTVGTIPLINGASTVFQQNVTFDINANATPQSVPRTNGAPVSVTNPLNVIDSNSAAYQGVVLFTGSSGVLTAAAQRGVIFICTASGTATMTFPDGSTLPVPIQSGSAIQNLPYSVTQIVLSNGAAGTFWGGK